MFNIDSKISINITNEKKIRKNEILDILIKVPAFCKLCWNKSTSLIENNSVNNPYLGRYTNKNCRKYIFKRAYIFGIFSSYNSKYYITYIKIINIG